MADGWEDLLEPKTAPAHDAVDVSAADPGYWDNARSLLSKLDEMHTVLTAELDDRGDLVEGSEGGNSLDEEWSGPFRDEFDAAEVVYAGLISHYTARLVTVRDDIYAHAELINAEQDQRNLSALDELEQTQDE